LKFCKATLYKKCFGKLETTGGKQKLNCANAKELLRIIQSIPSPKAEPIKQWLAEVGSDERSEKSKFERPHD
jgi:hypothetical protein